jgi:hypothetical protein
MSFAFDWAAWCDEKYLEKVRFGLNQSVEALLKRSDPTKILLTGLYIKKLGIAPTKPLAHDSPLSLVNMTDVFPGFHAYPHDECILQMDEWQVYRSYIPDVPSPVLLIRKSNQIVSTVREQGKTVRQNSIEAVPREGFHSEAIRFHSKLGIVNRRSDRGNHRLAPHHPTRTSHIQLCRQLYDGKIQFEFHVSLSLEASILLFTGLGLSVPIPQFAVLPIQSQIQKLFLSVNFWLAFVPIESCARHSMANSMGGRPWAQLYVCVKRGLQNISFSFDMEANHTLGHATEKQPPLKDVFQVTALLKETLSRLVHMNLVYPRFVRIDLL